jgi:hypothetical protein
MKKLLLCLLLSGCTNMKILPVSDRASDVMTKPRLPLLGVNQAVSQKVEDLFPIYHAQKTMILYQEAVDANNDGIFDGEEHLAVALKNYNVPSDYNGIIVMDWEGKAGTFLYTAPLESRAFASAVAQFFIAVKTAKKLRPNAVWGFYGIPSGTYWEMGEVWEKRLDAMKAIHDAVDAFFPSLYQAYQTPQEWTQEQDNNQVAYNIIQALKRANGKPVYPYIGTRYYTCCGLRHNHLVEEKNLHNHIAAAFLPQWNGDKIDGIIWWGADQYFYWVSQQLDPKGPYYQDALEWQPIFKEEVLDPSAVDAYWVNLHAQNLRVMREAIP